MPANARHPPFLTYSEGEYEMKNIVEIAAAGKQFKTLVAAVQAAGLAETLQGTGPFTVFAPTDEAFAKLPVGAVEGLLKDLPKLKSVLTYHVVSGKHLAKDVAGVKTAMTVQGGNLHIHANHGVRINDAKVTQADIEASNGVIHVIDSALLPA
jgi:uncharacterized surface protein with fasciclin (FAS1) repeats